MGVIWVVHEAEQLGFYNGHPDWCNLGQGQPEVGEMAGAPPRYSTIQLDARDHAYGPVGGTVEMREAVAAHYNRLYRAGRDSQYTKDNVAVASGGRLMLARMFATLGRANVGYQIPDYTAYEDMLDYHRYRITPVLVPTTPESGFMTSPSALGDAIERHGLHAYLLSNPCNPTGVVVRGDSLAAYVSTARERDCTLLLDEFYSHFIYEESGDPGDAPVSAAAYVDNVDTDPVLIVDGLTKNYRYPGWRLGWAVGPPHTIEMINRAASAIDGGPSTAVQRAALDVLQPDRADQETDALRSVFSVKRNLMVESLRAMGVRVDHEPGGTFYVWASIENLPAPLNDADAFFRAALERRVMTVPGRFFDVNPGQERAANAEYAHWVRFSFGPPEDNVRMGLQRLAELIAR
jgi:aspartate/methionine/tyrosine aminotransferase